MVERKQVDSNKKDAFIKFLQSEVMSNADLKTAWIHYMYKIANIYTILIKQYEKRIATMKSVLAHSESIINYIDKSQFTDTRDEQKKINSSYFVGICIELKKCIQFVSEKVEINGVDLMKNFAVANKHQSLEKLKITALCDIVYVLFNESEIANQKKIPLLMQNSLIGKDGDEPVFDFSYEKSINPISESV